MPRLLTIAAAFAGALAAALPSAVAADERLVSAGGVVTEILYALGAQSRIVGVDTTTPPMAPAALDGARDGLVRALSRGGRCCLSSRPPAIIRAGHAAGRTTTLRGDPPARRPSDRSGAAPTARAQRGVLQEETTRSPTIGGLSRASTVRGAAAYAQHRVEAARGPRRARTGLGDRTVRDLFVLSRSPGRAEYGRRQHALRRREIRIRMHSPPSGRSRVRPVTEEAMVRPCAGTGCSTSRRGAQRSFAGGATSSTLLLPSRRNNAAPAADRRLVNEWTGSGLLGFGRRAR